MNLYVHLNLIPRANMANIQMYSIQRTRIHFHEYVLELKKNKTKSLIT